MEPFIQPIPRRTIGNILHGKILDVAEKSTINGILNKSVLSFSALTIAGILIFPEKAAELFSYVIEYGNRAIPKTVGSFLVVFNLEKGIEFIKAIFPEKEEIIEGETIEGIPVFELLDHLFTFQSFKRDDIEKRFAIPRNRFTDLANKLEELQVLVRGENNSRVLNPEFSRSDVVLILSGVEEAKDLKQVFRQESDSTFTSKPTGFDILDRIKNVFTKKEDESPSFVSHKISELHTTA